MSNTFGPGFPKQNINPGHIHVRSTDENIEIYMYLGGDSVDIDNNWLLVTGSIAANPNTITWNRKQQGALWFNRKEKKYFGWNGSNVIQMSNIEADAPNKVFLSNDFISGSTANNLIGSFGITRTGPGNHDIITLDAGHAGIVRLRTSAAVPGSPSRLHQGDLAGDGFFLFSNSFDLSMVMRLNSIDANTRCRFGLCNNASLDPPATGVYFEKLQADTQWFAVVRADSVETRLTTGIPVAVTFSQFNFRAVDNIVEFLIDNFPKVNILKSASLAALQLFVQIRNFSSGQRSVDFDFFELEFTRGG